MTSLETLKEALATQRDRSIADMTVGELARALKDYGDLLDQVKFAMQGESRAQQNGMHTDRAQEAAMIQNQMNEAAERARLKREAAKVAEESAGTGITYWRDVARRDSAGNVVGFDRVPADAPS